MNLVAGQCVFSYIIDYVRRFFTPLASDSAPDSGTGLGEQRSCGASGDHSADSRLASGGATGDIARKPLQDEGC